MNSNLNDTLAEITYVLIGNPLSYDFGIVNVPFMVGCIFVAVLFYDLCRMLGALIHG